MNELQIAIAELEALLPLFDPVVRPTIHATLERVVERLKKVANERENGK